MSEEKKVVSRILEQPREWFDVTKDLPKPGESVVIRIFNEAMNFGEDDNGNIIAAEDMKIGVYMDNKWVIAPPYPKFDYSPLSNGPFLNDGSVVTHWAVPEKATEDDIGEVEAWESRFEVSGEYKHFVIEIDKEHEELLYRACSWATAGLRHLVGENSESLPLIGILWDIQALMDQDAIIKDGKVVKLCGDVSEEVAIINKAREMLREEE